MRGRRGRGGTSGLLSCRLRGACSVSRVSVAPRNHLLRRNRVPVGFDLREQPAVYAKYAVGVHGLVMMMRDQHDRRATPLQHVEDAHHLDPRVGIQHRGRFVEHQHARVHRQHSGDGDTLLLAAAHARRIRVAEPRHIHRLQGFVDAPADVVPSHAEVFRPNATSSSTMVVTI